MNFSLKVSVVFLSVLLIVNICLWNGLEVSSKLQIENGEIGVDVYIAALTGVETRGVDNVTAFIRGAWQAAKSVSEKNFTFQDWYIWQRNVPSRYFYPEESGWGYAHVGARFPVNATLHEIHEWSAYRNVIETRRGCVVINAHGSIIPIPSAYTKEAWVDKVAEAMLHRNVTWVHVGGYPFYHCQREQESSVEEWGEKGFQQLMKHIGKPNITCPSTAFEVSSLSSEARNYLLYTWSLGDFEKASVDWPLSKSDFNSSYVALKIWPKDYYTGAVIAFKKLLNQTSFGFYVHIGTNQTYHSIGWKTNKDYWRANAGCAAGLWSLVGRTAAEALIGEAEAVIQKAEAEGRTAGLDKAYKELEEGRNYYAKYFYGVDISEPLYNAMVFAEEAERPPPSFLEQNAAALLIALVACAAVGGTTAAVWQKRKNNKKEAHA